MHLFTKHEIKIKQNKKALQSFYTPFFKIYLYKSSIQVFLSPLFFIHKSTIPPKH